MDSSMLEPMLTGHGLDGTNLFFYISWTALLLDGGGLAQTTVLGLRRLPVVILYTLGLGWWCTILCGYSNLDLQWT
ncbi:uncharacterized protein BO96DRAFT_151214 [Aspergillus niger CBS 101883]|uniref:Uncharacterized protein n=1 Tax=Aspergillus niger ATCC 13496 TaxID=1353008 RepID=A0A370CFF8_ASPNG|nr:uncharacterized protein BO96DRAFT_151214 [Aspergillus niger CBS 101883]PYH60882.1 hypothetical protein BO96DRAFT_151214 [Aspergillus niger CBS 101883]RDH26069.1 hypothetical protein M747DRAFT_9024 [Aspergillus niger ATCC 13496]